MSIYTRMVWMALAIAVFALPPLAGDARAQGAVNNTLRIHIQKGGEGPLSKNIRLPLDKAAIVELPIDARDVLVSNPEIVDAVIRTSRRTYILGMQVGQTNAFFFDEAGRQILNLEIVVERDLAPLQSMFDRMLPSARLEIEAINDNVVLRGSVRNMVQAAQAADIAGRFIGDPEKVLSLISIQGSEQVMLQVRIVEMQRNLIKQLGIDPSGAFTVNRFRFDYVVDNEFSIAGRSLGGLAGTALSPPIGDLVESLQARIEAFERAGIIRTLAEPNLTAISGEAAKFLAGGEFPVPVSRDRDGNVQIEFKPFGVGLGFTPVVLDKGRISLQISTEVSDLSAENSLTSQGSTFVNPVTGEVFSTGLQIPGLNVRRAETTVELPSGGSLVMAGLLRDNLEQNIEGVPGLKDVAVLGSLFRSRDFLKNETELVIIVTPFIVEPTSRDALTDPAQGFAPASEAQTLLLGRLNAAYGVKGANPGGLTLQGPVGFILD